MQILGGAFGEKVFLGIKRNEDVTYVKNDMKIAAGHMMSQKKDWPLETASHGEIIVKAGLLRAVLFIPRQDHRTVQKIERSTVNRNFKRKGESDY